MNRDKLLDIITNKELGKSQKLIVIYKELMPFDNQKEIANALGIHEATVCTNMKGLKK